MDREAKWSMLAKEIVALVEQRNKLSRELKKLYTIVGISFLFVVATTITVIIAIMTKGIA